MKAEVKTKFKQNQSHSNFLLWEFQSFLVWNHLGVPVALMFSVCGFVCWDIFCAFPDSKKGFKTTKLLSHHSRVTKMLPQYFNKEKLKNCSNTDVLSLKIVKEN